MDELCQPDPFEEFHDIGIPTDDQVYSGNLGDEEYRKQLECLGTKRYGLKYQLSNLIFYDVWRRKRHGKISAPLPGFKWPVQPENLEKSYLVHRRPTKPTTEVLPVPLFRCVNRRVEKEVSRTKKAHFKRIQYKDNPLLEDISDELRNDPSPAVTVDQSFELHMALRDTVRKVWDQVKAEHGHVADELDAELGLEEPFLDRYLERVVATKTQTLLSELVDGLLDFRSHYPTQAEGDIRWYNLRGISKLTNVSQTAIQTTDARLKKLFPGIRDYEMHFAKTKGRSPEPKNSTGDQVLRRYYDIYKRSEGELGNLQSVEKNK
ncbi:hypothetical protein PSACC_03427 [Paramicrosporidium saccamoebae]|uniref:Uncharacterized protein n=1 Tax=Paramicrosporidium saccamoebae TaxID=1246581 RepID=A0A2H9TFX4_9FUNG|nr:hypothetical protein PSACC_03427 [Paramicrosporidium saccamoebae]